MKAMKITKALLFILMLVPASLMAQTKFGVIHYNEVFTAMPEYAAAQANVQKLKTEYDKEAARGELEFQRKFTEFLQGQKDFPENIMLKRQKELQDLQEKGLAFKQEAADLLSKAQKELQTQVANKLNNEIKIVASEQGLSFILNLDNNSCPFYNEAEGIDITTLVKEKLAK